MEQNKDQGNAAVRDEAVAECREDGRCQYAIDHGAEGMGHCPEGKCCMPVSARAADAPSEPSDSVMRAALERIARWHGEFPDTGKTWPTGGAVSYAAEYGSNGERDYMRQIALDALDALKSRAADALDSQPTKPSADVRARVRDAVWEQIKGNYYCGRVWDAWQVGTMTQDDFEPSEDNDEVLDNITDAVIAAVSSQPTDGGVRNG